MWNAVPGGLRRQLDSLEQDFLAIADLLFNLHYGPALEQLSATELDAETLLAFARESLEEVTLALGCCAKRQAVPRHDADGVDLTVDPGRSDAGFAFRLLAIASAFFGTVCCVQVRTILPIGLFGFRFLLSATDVGDRRAQRFIGCACVMGCLAFQLFASASTMNPRQKRQW